MLSSHTILAFAAFASLSTPCIAANASDLLDRVNHLAPLPVISPDLKRQVIASLPADGEVKVLSAAARKKLDSVTPMLKLHGRETDYLFKVVVSSQARVAIHAGFVVLVTDTALRLLTPGQIQALVAHEIGHEYVWREYNDARSRNDWPHVRELELFCDGVAFRTLVAIGVPASTLIDALRIMIASNERNGFVADPTHDSHPSLAERSRFSKEFAKRSSALASR